MSARILTVTGALEVNRAGTVLAPPLPWGDGQTRSLDVELRRPDGTRSLVRAHVRVDQLDVPGASMGDGPAGWRRMIYLEVQKAEAPPGTEVWAHSGVM